MDFFELTVAMPNGDSVWTRADVGERTGVLDFHDAVLAAIEFAAKLCGRVERVERFTTRIA